MDDLQDIKTRVQAACERLLSAAEEDRRQSLRLNDIAGMIEGSLSGHRADLDRLRGQLIEAEAEGRNLRAENDAARKALIQAREIANSLQARINQRDNQNEMLRRLLLELLRAIDADQRSALSEALHRIETGARSALEHERREVTPGQALVSVASATETSEMEPVASNDGQRVQRFEVRVVANSDVPATANKDMPQSDEIDQPAPDQHESIHEVALVSGEEVVHDPADESLGAPSDDAPSEERPRPLLREIAGGAP